MMIRFENFAVRL